jgi:hypothetical protein
MGMAILPFCRQCPRLDKSFSLLAHEAAAGIAGDVHPIVTLCRPGRPGELQRNHAKRDVFFALTSVPRIADHMAAVLEKSWVGGP